MSMGGLWQMGGLRKELDLCSEEEDVCGFVGMVGMVGLIEKSMAMGWMRPTANGVPFLGCRG